MKEERNNLPLYKAQRVDNGEWVTGYYANCCYPGDQTRTGHFIIEYPNKYHEIYTDTLSVCDDDIKEEKKRTNADKIRSLSDEELALFMERAVFCGGLLRAEESSIRCRGCALPFCCTGQYIDWLKREEMEWQNTQGNKEDKKDVFGYILVKNTGEKPERIALTYSSKEKRDEALYEEYCLQYEVFFENGLDLALSKEEFLKEIYKESFISVNIDEDFGEYFKLEIFDTVNPESVEEEEADDSRGNLDDFNSAMKEVLLRDFFGV